VCCSGGFFCHFSFRFLRSSCWSSFCWVFVESDEKLTKMEDILAEIADVGDVFVVLEELNLY